MPEGDVTQFYLLYIVMPIWLLAGIADWYCHRATDIATTSGWRESLIHVLMLAEVGGAVLLGLFFEINALVIGLMLAAFIAHEITAVIDLKYAWSRRTITPWEQHVHDYLAAIPFMALSFIIVMNWHQTLALFGLGPMSADFGLRLKAEDLPTGYVIALLVAILLFEVLPYGEELWRGWRLRHHSGDNPPESRKP